MTENGWGKATPAHCWRGAPTTKVQRLLCGALLARLPSPSGASGARRARPSPGNLDEFFNSNEGNFKNTTQEHQIFNFLGRKYAEINMIGAWVNELNAM
uniref:Uncharacterized protein n=1 Tax=Solanum demissum TaxID=50514 RepID=Q0KIN1_SOLDE|nr:hypothetical protein SDM1_4t00001 [Solanum demissum]ABI34331.1 hypothetical protein SDM1_40t00004 [Solanum demissum]